MKNLRKVLYLVVIFAILMSLFAFASEGSSSTAQSFSMAKLALGIGMGLSVFGGGIGQGLIGSKAMESIGRNPESASRLFVPMLIALAFVESLVIYMLVIAFMKF